MEAGLVLDEQGQRFVVLTFKEPGEEPLLVTFTVPIFPELCRAPCPYGKGSQRRSQLGHSRLTRIAHLDDGFLPLER